MQEPGSNPATENDPLPDQELLARIVAEFETEDNKQMLAEKLLAEWKQSLKNHGQKPDLSFAKFAEKMKSHGDQ
ncbi:hypothetical protein DYBT9623_04073 [Dyadobacter sp. CECT 9623]|uniref:Uncharacterized protein n=1 Tax=Dyadobacter linearis TaxID=2823330 RepID=A0ABM8UUR8_9BACT|nr:hypothetical protein [Dyadobacter sp. CECT 9623]CAG5072198.1 hypothetical protein DYBT9623_04073 [Dyadobacter sp. CECT 9623]